MADLERVSNQQIQVGDVIELFDAEDELADVVKVSRDPAGDVVLDLRHFIRLRDGSGDLGVAEWTGYVLPADGHIRRQILLRP
jgi:hypothetical protein